LSQDTEDQGQAEEFEAYNEDDLRRAATLGDTVRRELQNGAGLRLIVEKADQQKQAALDELCSAPHIETDKLRSLHLQIYQANQIGVWLEDLIAQGEAAQRELASQDLPDT